jgi:hypothetical protein
MSRGPDASSRARPCAIPDRVLQHLQRRNRAQALRALALACALLATAASPADRPGTAAEVAQRLARLDCAYAGADDVRDVLRHVPAPRIVLLQGSIPLVTMEPFARFLIGMGYPAERLRDPRTLTLSRSSFADSAELAGELAYDYERTGLQPMLIGHSQGGMLALRVLHELAGAFHGELSVVDPETGAKLPRTTIVDPITQRERPVVGLRVAYAAALATGWLPRVMLGQWSMLPLLRKIPDTVTQFTGFDLAHDAIAGNFGSVLPYEPLGTARVENVLLPAAYSHIGLPRAEALLAADLRAWIDAPPGQQGSPPDGDPDNLVHAADIWRSVKFHWCAQAQRLLLHQASRP